MKSLFASLIAALFVLAGFAAYAVGPVAATDVLYSSDDSKDGGKAPTTDGEQKDEEKKPETDKEEPKS